MASVDPLYVFRAKLAKAGKSPTTISTYESHLKYFFRRVGLEPFQFLEKAKAKEIDVAEEINKVTDAMIAEGLKKSFVRIQVFAVKKFIKVLLGKDIDHFSQIALDEIGRDAKVKEKPLDVKDIRAAFRSCRTKRDKALLMVAAVTGIREMELAGLLVGDIKEEKDKVVLTVRDETAKGRHGYISFLTPEAHEILKDYLEERQKRGEEIKPESILFLPTNNPLQQIVHNMTPNAIGMIFREIFRRAGLIPPPVNKKRVRHDIRPHSIRKFTRRMYLMAGIDIEVAEKLLGHGVEELSQIYTPMSVDELWGYYKKAIPFLTIEKQVDLTPLMRDIDSKNRQLESDNLELRQHLISMEERMTRYESFTQSMMNRTPEEWEKLFAIQERMLNDNVEFPSEEDREQYKATQRRQSDE